MLPVLRRFFQLVLLVSSLMALACVQRGAGAQGLGVDRGAGDGFFFVQITDTHLGDRNHLARTRKLVDEINALPYEIACVVHTGDIFADNITDAAVREEGLGVLKHLKAPLHLLPGNHDILEGNLEETLRVFTREVGPLIHRAEYGGWSSSSPTPNRPPEDSASRVTSH